MQNSSRFSPASSHPPLFSPHDEEVPSAGSPATHNSLNRRSFLKRSGGATAATLVSWHLGSATARAAQKEVHACTPRSDDRYWHGDQKYTLSPQAYASKFGSGVGNGIANNIVTGLAALTAGPVKDWINANSNWEDVVRAECVSGMTTFFQSQTQSLAWDFEGEGLEKKKCKHLNNPKITKSGQASTTSFTVGLSIAGFGITLSGNVTYDYNTDSPAYFNSSTSELIQIPVPQGSVPVAADGQFTTSVSATTGGGIIQVGVSGSASADTADISVPVS